MGLDHLHARRAIEARKLAAQEGDDIALAFGRHPFAPLHLVPTTNAAIHIFFLRRTLPSAEWRGLDPDQTRHVRYGGRTPSGFRSAERALTRPGGTEVPIPFRG